jgi:hypothetical protein
VSEVAPKKIVPGSSVAALVVKFETDPLLIEI